MTSSSVRNRFSAGLAIAVVALVSVTWSAAAPAAADGTAFTIDDFQGNSMGVREVVQPDALSCDLSQGTSANVVDGNLKVAIPGPDTRGCLTASAEIRWTADTSVDIRQGGADRIELRYRDVLPNQPGALVFGLRVTDVSGNTAQVGGLSRNGGAAGDWLTIRYAPAYVGDVAVLQDIADIDTSQVKSISLMIAATSSRQNVSVTLEGAGGSSGEPEYQAPAIGAESMYVFPASQQSSHIFEVTGDPAPDVAVTGMPAWMTVTTTQGTSATTVTLAGNPGAAYAQTDLSINAVVANSLTAHRDVSIVTPSPVTVTYTAAQTTVGATGPLVLGLVSAFPATTIRSTPTGLPPGTSLALIDGDVVLEGTPTAGGDYTVSAQVGHDWDQVAFTRNLTVTEVPVMASVSAQYLPVDTEMLALSIVASGHPAPTFTSTGLPAGLSLSATGVLTGTPTDIGDARVTVTATNSAGSTSTQLRIVVGEAPVVSLPDSVQWWVGVPVALDLYDGPYEHLAYPSIPEWASFRSENGVLSLVGTPTLDPGESEKTGVFRLQVGNEFGAHTDTVEWTVTRPVAPVIYFLAGSTVTVGQAVDISVVVTSTPEASVTVSGLPTGLTWQPDSSGGRIVGTADAVGTWAIELTATNGIGDPVVRTVTIQTVRPEITLETDASAVTAGDSVHVSAAGFQAGEAVEVWLHSDPVLLARGNAAPDGTFALTVVVPSTVAPGAHTLVLLGASGATASLPLTLVAAVPDNSDGTDETDTDTDTDATGTDATGASQPAGTGEGAAGESGLAATGVEPWALIAVSLLALAGGALLLRRTRP